MKAPEVIIDQNITKDVFGLEIGARCVDTEVEAKYVEARSFNNMAVKLLYGLFGGQWYYPMSGFFGGQGGWNKKATHIPAYHGNTGYNPSTIGTTSEAYIKWFSLITSMRTTNPIRFVANYVSNYGSDYIRAGSYVQISGVSGLVEANGVHRILRVNMTSNLVELDGVSPGATPFDGASAVAPRALWHVNVASPTASNIPWSGDYVRVGPDSYAFYYPWIFVGGSSRPMNKLQYGLANQIWNGTNAGQLTYQGRIISEPAVALATSTITLTQTYTNNDITNRDIQIKEAAIAVEGYYTDSSAWYYTKHIIARDTVTITALNGSTVELSYRFNIHSTPTGGFLRQFGELLYRHLSGASREAKTTANQNVSQQESDGTFRLVSPAGGECVSSVPFDATSNVWGFEYGLVPGSSTVPVDFEDYKLGAQIAHGASTDQLYYLSTSVDFFTENTTTASFDITRYFHNMSAATVTVKEVGLYTTRQYDDDNIHCIARHILGTPLQIPSDTIGRITYRLSS